jgi:hypothetical protein
MPAVTVDDVFANGAPCEFPARWSVRHDVGDGVGFTRGFTYVEGFIPLWQPAASELVFGDARVVNFDDADRWEFNVGAGYRLHAVGKDAVLGFNGFYDGRHTDNNFFHQLGLGVEALFARWEVRANGYVIVGPDRRLASDTGEFSLPVGNQVLIARLLTHDVAMGGVDVEAGVLLPAIGRVAPRVYLGAYHYASDHLPSANGIRARFEAWLGRNVTLHGSVQNDDVFDTTVTGGLAIHFGGADVARNDGCDPSRGIDERLGQRVVRDVNIVVAQTRTLTTRVLPPPPEPPSVVQEPPRPVKPPEDPDAPPNNTLPPVDDTVLPPACKDKSRPKCQDEQPKCVRPPDGCLCLPFPGRPGDPSTFPGRKFPPGFHHPCFPGRGRYKHASGTGSE